MGKYDKVKYGSQDETRTNKYDNIRTRFGSVEEALAQDLGPTADQEKSMKAIEANRANDNVFGDSALSYLKDNTKPIAFNNTDSSGRHKNLGDTLGSLFFNATSKAANLAIEGGRVNKHLADLAKESVFGSDKSYHDMLVAANRDEFGAEADQRNKDGGIFKNGTGFKSNQAIVDLKGGDVARQAVGRGLQGYTELAPYGRGYQAAAGAAKGAKLANILFRGAAEGTIVAGVGEAGKALEDPNQLSFGQAAKDLGVGGLTGTLGAGFGKLVGAGAKTIISKFDHTPKPITDTARLLGTGAEWRQTRVGEIDKELANLPGSKFKPTDTTMANIEKPQDTLLGDTTFNANKKDGQVSVKSGTVMESSRGGTMESQNDVARKLFKEKAQLQNEINGVNSIQHEAIGGAAVADTSNPVVHKAVDSELKATQSALEPDLTGVKNTKSANLVDYFRSPLDVLKRIGLGKVADTVDKSFTKYRIADSNSGRMIETWQKELTDPESAKRIFNALDGKGEALTVHEQSIATDMRSYLNKYADDLGLKPEQRVSNYITHVFKDVIDGKSVDGTYAQLLRKGNEADLSTAQMLEKKVNGKVNFGFDKKRTSSSENYTDDLFKVLDIYTKRANRKIYMEPALKAISTSHANVDARTARYLESLNNAITLKPSKIDQFFDDSVASLTGDRLGPNAGTRGLRVWRQNIYRATLGGNVGSAVRNLTQLTNTFAEVPPKDFLTGMSQFTRSLANKTKNGEDELWTEMVANGVFDDAIHKQDSNVGVIKKGLEKLDPILFSFFNTAERINRGGTYAAGKSYAMRKLGMGEAEAMKYGADLVGKTQFRFNSIETPLAFKSQVSKTVGQFGSYPVRQADYLANLGKGAVKRGNNGQIQLDAQGIRKITKYIGANLAIAGTLGEVMGFDWKSALPQLGGLAELKSPTSQILFGDKNKTGLVDLAQGKDAYGNTPGQKDANGDPVLDKNGKPVMDKVALAKDFLLGNAAGLVIPGGAQGKKTIEGIQAVSKGKETAPGGGLKYDIPKTPGKALQAAVFGKYALPESRAFYDNGGQAFTSKQSDVLSSVDPNKKVQYENFYRALASTPTKKDGIGKKVDRAIQNQEYEKARRLTIEHNSQIKSIISDLKDSVGGSLPPKLEDDINSQYMIDYNYYKNKKRTK